MGFDKTKLSQRKEWLEILNFNFGLSIPEKQQFY
jgi:hypothetical protein